MGWDSSVGIETGYELDGSGIDSRWGRDILYLSRPALGPTQLYNGYRVFSGVKRPGRGVDLPHPSSTEAKKKSRALPLLLLWTFVACSKLKFTFTFTTGKLFV